VAGLALGAIAVAWYPPAMRPALWLVALSLLPSAVVVTAETVLTARERLGVVATVNVAEGLARTVAWLALLEAGYGVTAMFVVLVAGRLLAVLLYARVGGLASTVRLAERSATTVRLLLAQSPTYLGILLLAGGIQRLDFLLLGRLGDLRQVGLYSAPYKVYEVALMVPSVLSVVLFPAVSRAAEQSPQRLGELTRQICRFCVSVGLPCAVLLSFLSRPLVGTLFGAEFVPAASVLAILAFVPVIAAVDQALTMVLLASGRQQLDLTVLAVACGCYAAMLVVLIPPYGYLGAAAATAVTAAVQVVARLLAARRVASVRGVGGVVLGPSLAAGAMALVIAGLLRAGLPLALGLAAGSVAYGVALRLVRAVTAADLRALHGALATRGEVVP
jgi:O-antigen/teichoic acid export membrane protein